MTPKYTIITVLHILFQKEILMAYTAYIRGVRIERGVDPKKVVEEFLNSNYGKCRVYLNGSENS